MPQIQKKNPGRRIFFCPYTYMMHFWLKESCVGGSIVRPPGLKKKRPVADAMKCSSLDGFVQKRKHGIARRNLGRCNVALAEGEWRLLLVLTVSYRIRKKM
jgi:hypothetical protein